MTVPGVINILAPYYYKDTNFHQQLEPNLLCIAYYV